MQNIRLSVHLCLIIWVAYSLLYGCQMPESSREQETGVSWRKLGPGGGGSTFIPTFSYQDEDHFLLKCDMTGAYKSNNGGKSFDQINFANGSTSFAYAPKDSQTIYIGSHALNKSVDGGKTWERIFPPESDIVAEEYVGDHANYHIRTKEKSLLSNIDGPIHLRNIKVDPNDPLRIYFSIDEHFIYSTDGGFQWQQKEFDDEIEFIYTNEMGLKGIIYIFTSKGLHVFDLQTESINIQAFPTDMQPAFSLTGGRSSRDQSVLFYGLHNDPSLRSHGGIAPTTLWISRDLGQTWQQNQASLILNEHGGMPTYSTLSAAENQAEKVYVVTSNYQEISGSKILHWFGAIRSSDGGQSWRWVWKGGGGSGQYGARDGIDAENLEDGWVHEAFGGEYIRLIDVGVAPNNGEVAIVTDWYRTMLTEDGGGSWRSVNSKPVSDESYTSTGLDVTTAYGVHFDPFDSNHIAISYTDIGYHHSYDGGNSWIRSTQGIPTEWHNTCYWLVFDPNVQDKIWSVWSSLHDFPRGKMTRNPKWTSYGKGGVAMSEDGGRSWTPQTEGIDFNSPATSIVLDSNSPIEGRVLYVSVFGKGIYKSVDGGASWQEKNEGIDGSLAAFEITIQPDGTLFLITSATPQHRNGSKGREVYMGALYRSTDGADTWQPMNIGEKTGFPSGLEFDPNNLDRLYLGAWSSIHLSDLIGGSLARSTGGNELIELVGGILLSEDKGETWRSIFDQNHYVYDITVDPRFSGRVYCNTFDQGAYRSDDHGRTWHKIKGYDFHWGHRAIVDEHDPNKIYLSTYGSSIWHGVPAIE